MRDRPPPAASTYALANRRKPATQKLLSETVVEFFDTKDHDREQYLLSDEMTPPMPGHSMTGSPVHERRRP